MTEAAPPPDGYRLIPIQGGFFDAFGPLFIKTTEEHAGLAFRVAPNHVNPNGVCHGGALSTFADMQAFAAQWLADIVDRFTPTINLSVDYVAPAQLGDLLEMRTVIWHATRSLLFAKAPITTSSGKLIASTSAVFSIARVPHPHQAFFAALFPTRRT